ncbi:MAG TPA: aminotransferase class I/II-fold pyridoxal phosphate-dependent enzyme [Symbiobacteriaceae bacterium]|jgi:aminotransferase|nr:aminotransferase class I/II-fold pyridoxal phosphate-dependent enzyme [Symbiobacteriaceae bacterium]
MRSFVNPAMAALPPSGIRKFFDLVAQSRGIISLGVGEPDFTTPWHIRESAIYALERGRTTYTSNWGMPELREAISRHLEAWQGLRYNPADQILVTVGVAEAIDLTMRAVLEPGDEILIPEPCFVSYVPCAVMAGGKAVTIPLRAEDDFKLTPELLRQYITPKTKVLFIGFPANPTGAVMTAAELEAVAQVVREHDLLVITDEIYGDLSYGQPHQSIAALPGMKERTVLLNGFSKAYAMTGWRIGYACGPAEILGLMMKIHQYTIMCPSIMGQIAAMEALKNGAAERDKMVAEYDRRRKLMYSGFTKMGLPCFEPKGAFYIFPSIAPTGMDDETFALKLLEEEKVAVVPGSAFGSSGKGHIRCSYATSVANLTEALKRIGSFVERHS